MQTYIEKSIKLIKHNDFKSDLTNLVYYLERININTARGDKLFPYLLRIIYSVFSSKDVKTALINSRTKEFDKMVKKDFYSLDLKLKYNFTTSDVQFKDEKNLISTICKVLSEYKSFQKELRLIFLKLIYLHNSSLQHTITKILVTKGLSNKELKIFYDFLDSERRNVLVTGIYLTDYIGKISKDIAFKLVDLFDYKIDAIIIKDKKDNDSISKYIKKDIIKILGLIGNKDKKIINFLKDMLTNKEIKRNASKVLEQFKIKHTYDRDTISPELHKLIKIEKFIESFIYDPISFNNRLYIGYKKLIKSNKNHKWNKGDFQLGIFVFNPDDKFTTNKFPLPIKLNLDKAEVRNTIDFSLHLKVKNFLIFSLKTDFIDDIEKCETKLDHFLFAFNIKTDEWHKIQKKDRSFIIENDTLDPNQVKPIDSRYGLKETNGEIIVWQIKNKIRIGYDITPSHYEHIERTPKTWDMIFKADDIKNSQRKDILTLKRSQEDIEPIMLLLDQNDCIQFEIKDVVTHYKNEEIQFKLEKGGWAKIFNSENIVHLALVFNSAHCIFFLNITNYYKNRKISLNKIQRD